MSSKWRKGLLVLIAVVVPLYVANAQWGTEANHDVIAANVSSWQVVRTGDLDLSGFSAIRENLDHLRRWYVPLPNGRIVTNRTPGLIGIAIPAYAMFRSAEFSVAPGTAVAVASTVISMALVWTVLSTLIGPSKATIATVVLAVGTPTWWISGAQLWPHGPDQLWAALALVSLARASYFGAGGAFALSILTRPVTGVFAAVAGIAEGVRLKSLTPIWKVGVVAATGVAALVLYNRLVFGAWSLAGGYFGGSVTASGAFSAEPTQAFSLIYYVRNLFDMFVGLPHGVLVTTPIIGVSAVGAWIARKSIPGWAVSAALAGIGYLVVHAALNRASGGLGVFYRYPLEAIVLAAPSLAIGANTIWDSGRLGKRVVYGSAAISIFLMVLYVFYLVCFYDPSAPLCVERWL